MEHLNKSLKYIKSQVIRIVWYREEEGVKMIWDIVEFDRKHFSTPKTKVVSKEGQKFLLQRSSNKDFNLIEFEEVN